MLGALLLACGAVPSEDPVTAEPSTQPQELRTSLEAQVEEALVGPEFRVNQPVLRMLETLPAGNLSGGPAVASDGEVYLIVWPDLRRERTIFGGFNLFGQRVKRDGTLLDSASFIVAEPLSEDPTFIQNDAPAVEFDGRRFLVLWEGDGDDGIPGLFLTRVERDGDSLDPEGVPLPGFFGGFGRTPDIACDGAGTCLAVRINFLPQDDLLPEETSTVGGVLLRDGEVAGTEPIRIAGLPAVPDLNSAVAWSGREFLVIWEDLRSGSRHIYGARVSRDGTVMDPGGFPITTMPGGQGAPDVAWTGSHFLVVWEERSVVTFASDLFGARVTSDGTVLDPSGIPLSTAVGDQVKPRVSAGAGTTLVVWTDFRTGRQRIRGTRVEGADVLDPSGFAVSHSLFMQDSPAVAFGGGHFLVSFAALREGASFPWTVLAARVDTDGDTLDAPALRVLRGAPAQRIPTAAFGGGKYLVAWEDERDDAGTHIRAARVRPDGSVIESNGIRLPSAPGSTLPEVAFDGRNFLVAWMERGPTTTAVRAARVSPSGKVLDPSGIFIATVRTVPDTFVDVASGGGLSLIVWSGVPSTSQSHLSELRGARLTRDGAVLDPGGFPISVPGDGLQQDDPAVAFAGDRFLIAYTERGPGFFRLRATRVTTGGTVLDPAGILIANGGQRAAIASTGTQALVVWNGFGAIFGLRGARLLPSGTVLDPVGFLIATSEGLDLNPTVTFDGSRYWVAWEAYPGTVFGWPDLLGARVQTSGTVQDPEPVPLSTTELTEESSPALASDGQGGSAVFYSRFERDAPVRNLAIQGRMLESDQEVLRRSAESIPNGL